MHNGILFEDVTRAMADESIQNCIKYLCNNFFNCFGFEVKNYIWFKGLFKTHPWYCSVPLYILIQFIVFQGVFSWLIYWMHGISMNRNLVSPLKRAFLKSFISLTFFVPGVDNITYLALCIALAMQNNTEFHCILWALSSMPKTTLNVSLTTLQHFLLDESHCYGYMHSSSLWCICSVRLIVDLHIPFRTP